MQKLEDMPADTGRSPDEVLIYFMRRLVAHGFIKALVRMKETCPRMLSESQFQHVREEYAEICSYLDWAVAIEKEHGTGALLDLDDPFVWRLVRSSVPKVSLDQLENARAYRELVTVQAA